MMEPAASRQAGQGHHQKLSGTAASRESKVRFFRALLREHE